MMFTATITCRERESISLILFMLIDLIDHMCYKKGDLLSRHLHYSLELKQYNWLTIWYENKQGVIFDWAWNGPFSIKKNAHSKWCNIMNFLAHLQHYLHMTMTLWTWDRWGNLQYLSNWHVNRCSVTTPTNYQPACRHLDKGTHTHIYFCAHM